MALADQVLERRPGYRLALHAQGVTAGVLVSVAQDELDAQAALRGARRQERVELTLLRLDPNNVVNLNNLAVAEGQLGNSLWAAGRLREAVPYFLKQLDYGSRASAGGAIFAINRSAVMAGAVAWPGGHLPAAPPQVGAELREDAGADDVIGMEKMIQNPYTGPLFRHFFPS